MYSFEPDDEQKMMVEVIHRYAVADLRPAARVAEETGALPEVLIQKGWEIGMLQASAPEQYGGAGGHSSVTGVLALEELAFGDAAAAIGVCAPGLFAYPLMSGGSEAQKAAYLPRLLSGPWLPFTAALIEPRFDFDPNLLATAARIEGDFFILTGEKMFVPYAAEAQAILVYAALDGRTQGFIVPRDVDGLVIQERQKTLGMNALPVYRMTLDSVRLPFEARLGNGDGHDFDILLASFRLANSALALGVSRAAFEYSRDYAKDREVFGVKVAQKQAIAFMLAEMATELESARLLTWEAAWRLDRLKPDWSKAAYLAEIDASDLVMSVTDRAVQILGGHGYIREHPVELWMRNGREFASIAGLAMV
jgi:alkylation response protein AidB-like acyl-CoA dehydrogenase